MLKDKVVVVHGEGHAPDEGGVKLTNEEHALCQLAHGVAPYQSARDPAKIPVVVEPLQVLRLKDQGRPLSGEGRDDGAQIGRRFVQDGSHLFADNLFRCMCTACRRLRRATPFTSF